jgi:hypothetical protein
MSDIVDVIEHELEGMDFVGLGDAAEETRQFAPAHFVPDSVYGWGYPAREPA